MTHTCLLQLERHMVVHSKTKPFMCEVCNHGFSQKPSLVQHIKNFHPNAPLPQPVTSRRSRGTVRCDIMQTIDSIES